jgi:Concanavalin A-like lectin/glucanases superfamily
MLTPAPVGTPGAAVASANNVVTPTTLTPATGSGYAVGDTLICFTACSSATPTVATPAGWTSILNVTGTNGRLALFAKVATSTSEAAPSVVWSGLTTGTSGTPCQAIVAAFTNLEVSVLASMADVVGASASGTASTATSSGGAAITTTLDKDLVLSLTTRLDDAFTTFTAPAGFTNITAAQGTTSGNDFAMGWAYQVKTPAGVVTAPNFGLTGASSFASTGVMIALKGQSTFNDTPTGTMTMLGTRIESGGRSAYAGAVLATSGLVSYWRLDEASGNALDEKGTNPGTVAGGITRQASGLVPGDSDTAMRGNGVVGTYVNVPDSASLDVGAQLSVECWLKIESYVSGPKFVSRWSADTCWYLAETSNTGIRWYVRDVNGVDTNIDAQNAIEVGVRQHLVAVYDAAGSMKLYVNGVSVGTPGRTPNANVRLGAGPITLFADDASSPSMQGTLDDVAFYNTALTPQQVLDHYTVGMAGYEKLIQQTPGLVSYMRLGEASGPVADTKGTIAGTATGGITRQVPGLLVNDADAAIQGSGAVSTNVDVPWSAKLDVGAQLTLEFWVKPTAMPAGTLYPIGRLATSTSLWFIRNYGGTDGRWEFNVYDTASTRHSFSAPGLTADMAEVGKRQHVVMTYDAAGTMKGYVNGVSVGTGAPAPGGLSARSDSSTGFRIVDARNDPTTFAAVFDEVAIYNVALTAQQVLDHYNIGLGAVSNSDAPTGILLLSGTRTESFTPGPKFDTPTGIFRLSGSVVEQYIDSKPRAYTDMPVGTLLLSGGVLEFNPTGFLTLVGSPIRERAPLHHSISGIAPNGNAFRWGSDEPSAENIFNGLRWSSTMPGGHDSMDCVLPREPGVDYQDLERLSTLQVIGPGGSVDGEFRLERTPQTSGDQMAISPSAVGWQAHLDDNKGVSIIFIDRELGEWGDPSRQRQLGLLGAGFNPIGGGSVVPDTTTGTPALDLGFDDPGGWTISNQPIVEPLYDAGPGNSLGRLRGTFTVFGMTGTTNVNWVVGAILSAVDTLASGNDGTGDLFTGSQGASFVFEAIATAKRRFAALQFYFSGAGGAAGSNSHYGLTATNLRAFGDHNLTIRGSTPQTEGFWASDVVRFAVMAFAPMLKVTSDSIQATNFVIPQLKFKDQTTTSEIVKGSTRFGLEDWAVWNDKIFYLSQRNAMSNARKWRARIGPARLEQTGQQMDRLWESILVQYTDVDGTTRVVGPPGSGVDIEDASLKDTDPENPANKLGIKRRDKLVMGTSTPAGAIQVGQRFLAEQKLIDRSGRATLVGYVEDDHGILWPYSEVKAGDAITFVDAADSSYRRIVKADHDDGTKSATVDLDAPPEGLQAVLERLGVALAPLGL